MSWCLRPALPEVVPVVKNGSGKQWGLVRASQLSVEVSDLPSHVLDTFGTLVAAVPI